MKSKRTAYFILAPLILAGLTFLVFRCNNTGNSNHDSAAKGQDSIQQAKELPEKTEVMTDEQMDDEYSSKRNAMVEEQLRARGITNPLVLKAMGRVKRHLFVPERYRQYAYDDGPLPIGLDQTISQPYIVAYMTETVDPKPGMKVLEVGTGSGYQSAVLAEIVGEVYTIEYFEELAKNASNLLKSLGYKNIKIKTGDGFFGWKEYAPFDAIIVTASPEDVPQPLIDQLREGGRMIIPLGGEGNIQSLVILKKTGGKIERQEAMKVKFVPFLRK